MKKWCYDGEIGFIKINEQVKVKSAANGKKQRNRIKIIRAKFIYVIHLF